MRITNYLNDFKTHLITYIYAQESGVIGKQRVTVMAYSSALIILGVILNLCGVLGPTTLFFKIANISQGTLIVIGFCLYYSRHISLSATISFYCIVLQTEISVETIYCALNQTPYYVALILANVVLTSVILFLGIISYLRIIPSIVALMSLVSYGISIYITRSSELESFFLVFLIIFIALLLMGLTMTSNMSYLNHENTKLNDEKKEILDVFRLTNEEIRSYVALARENKLEPERTAALLASVGNFAEKKILDNVTHYIRQSSIDYDNLHKRLPELTTSELEICTLILKEKKIKEISKALGKTQSNITCQRTNIRSKLHLQKDDNLLEELRKRLTSRR